MRRSALLGSGAAMDGAFAVVAATVPRPLDDMSGAALQLAIAAP